MPRDYIRQHCLVPVACQRLAVEGTDPGFRGEQIGGTYLQRRSFMLESGSAC